MIPRTVRFCLLAFALLGAACGKKAQTNQKHERVSVLGSPVEMKTVVRLFYYPAGDHIRIPLLFRVVKEGDPLLNTAPMLEEGRTAYISLAEMHDIVQALTRSGLGWKESETVEALGSYKDLTLAGIGLDTMEVRVVSSGGTAIAQISPKAICVTLKPLDAALKTPRALWEFQGFQLNYGCKVPGFKPDAYPDHY